MSKKKQHFDLSDTFRELKREIAYLDPVSFVESTLTINGTDRFDLTGSGWKYMAEIYRTIAAQVESKSARPIVLLKSRQVGATVMSGALSLHMASSGLYGTEVGKPPIRVMHAFPDLKRCGTYAKDILGPMISGSIDQYVAKRSLKTKHKNDIEDTQAQKNFLGHNKLRIDSVGKTADRIRGSTQDVLFLDEVQDMTQTAIENSLKILLRSPYGAETKGVQVFFGTPKHAGSYFWTLWEQSDQRFFHLRCVHCQNYFQLYNLENDDWSRIWVNNFIVNCPHCTRAQDKRQAADLGKWIASKPEAKFIGYHFNMMLVPVHSKEQVLELWPKHNVFASPRAWENETLGKFYSAGSVPLTLEEVVANALDETRGRSKKITNPNGKYYLLGMDWGDKPETDDPLEAKRGQSFTVAVILSVDIHGVMTIENAVRFKKTGLEYKVNAVKALMEDFKINQAVADQGHGHDVIDHLQNGEGGLKDKFLGCITHGTTTNAFNFNKARKQITINRHLVLEEVFNRIKTGKIKFPAKGDCFDTLRWLIDQCCSMETHVQMRDGIPYRRFEKGTLQNDGLMALVYAYTAYQYLATQGFSQNSAVKNSDRHLKPILGYVPNLR